MTKKYFALSFSLFLSTFSFAALSPGDIAIVQYNADGTDDFAFVALVDIPANEEIKFTDNGWKADDTFKTNEGIITWTAPAGGVTARDVVTITMSPSATVGTVTKSGIFNFLATGDQLIAYQGTSSMIAAINNEGAGVWQTDSPNTSESKLPLGLRDGIEALALSEVDNARFTGDVTTGTKEELLAAINDRANWVGSDTEHQTFGAPLPIVLNYFKAYKKGPEVILAWETSQEVNNEFFTVERSVDGRSFEEIDFVRGAGTSMIAQKYQFWDKNPIHGLNYYRLSQTDYDGQIETFEVVVVDFKLTDPISIHPTQVNDVIILTLTPSQTDDQVSIFSLLGQKVYDEPISAETNKIGVDASRYSPGQYFVRVSHNHQIQTTRFIKL